MELVQINNLLKESKANFKILSQWIIDDGPNVDSVTHINWINAWHSYRALISYYEIELIKY